MMRPKYYIISLRQMRKNKSFVFLFTFLVMIIIMYAWYQKIIYPTLLEFCKSHGYSLAMRSTESAIRTNLENLKDNSIISAKYDENQNLTAIQTNTGTLNSVSNGIAIDIENNIANVGENSIKIPFGLFFNLGIFGGNGVKVKIKTVPTGDTKIECISQFDSVGINQTRHRIIFKIKTNYTLLAPIYLKNQFYEKEIVIAETVFTGNIPESYYNLDLNEPMDTLNVL